MAQVIVDLLKHDPEYWAQPSEVDVLVLGDASPTSVTPVQDLEKACESEDSPVQELDSVEKAGESEDVKVEDMEALIAQGSVPHEPKTAEAPSLVPALALKSES